MSLVTLIRDYVDIANSSKQLDGYTFSSLVYYTLGFLFSLLKQVIVNFCTFQWVRDFSYFCLTPPMLFSSFANINVSEGVINGVDKIEHQSLSNLVAFSETNFLSGIRLVLLGLFNGCFTSMHVSAVNLVTIQRLLVQGVPAGLCSALGTAIGQCFFLACVHFGFRALLFPWLSLEPLPFLLGLGILLAIASNSAQDRRTPTIQWSAKSFLLTYTFTSVALAWCEQTALFQLMGNLSFGAEPTLLETTPSFETIETIFGNIQQVINNGSYLLAFFLGNFLGTFFLAYALQRLLELLLNFKGIPIYYGLIKEANLPLATLIFAFGFGSLPYYGFNYLITKGFGFLPQEQVFQQTLFSPVNLVSKTSQTKEPTQGRLEDQLALLFTLEGEKNKSFVVDTTPFDDGQYLKVGQKRPQAFEDLNYRGEHLWTNRLSRISNIREQANQTQSSFLGPVFSWMRAFLWGEGPTNTFASKSIDANNKNSINSVNNNNVTTSFASPIGNKLASENTKRKKELSAEREQLDNYVKEFDRQFDKGFSNYHNAEPISLIEVEDQWQEQRIKKKCYTNPIYTFLLNTEIDLFLGRQPNYHRLSTEEEILLLKRRQLLSNYYDTLALTSQIPTSQAFNQLVPKSYTNAIYNHQFKGTLKIARRLFSIKNALTLQSKQTGVEQKVSSLSQASKNTRENFGILNSSPPEGFASKGEQTLSGSKLRNPSSNINEIQTDLLSTKLIEKPRVIKFDQPLFSKEKSLLSSGNNQLPNSTTQQKKILFHEELNSDSKQIDSSTKSTGFLQNPSLNEIISPVTTIGLPDFGQARDLSNKEMVSSYSEGIQLDKNVFLLEQAESLPLYASWDDELRKLILTNRFQSRIKAGYTYSTEQDFRKTVQSNRLQVSQEKNSPHSLLTHVSFTAWPLPNPLVLPLESETLQKTNTEKNKKIVHVDNKSKNGKNVFRPLGFVQNWVDSLIHTTFHAPRQLLTPKGLRMASPFFDVTNDQFKNSSNQFLFPTQSIPSNDMINALLQWQKLIKDHKQLSKEDKQAAKEKVSYWPKNVRRANWSTELMDNDIEFDEPVEMALKKQIILWEFIPPNYGGFIWPGIK